MTVEEMVAEGDTVMVRMTVRGTHRGDFMRVGPTGKEFSVSGVDVIHFSGGKGKEVWHFDEELVMWQQLGVAPPLG